MKSYKNYLINLSLLFTLCLFGVASFYPLESMWGINHLQFLPSIFTYLYWAVVVIVIYLMFAPIPIQFFDKVFSKVDNLLWGKRISPKLLFIIFCTAIFYLFRVETHFLGDGYFLLNVFGLDKAYTNNWIEPGSILLIKNIQQLLGGYSTKTALIAFQGISIVSGFIVLLNFISIIGKICDNSKTRIFGFVTLCFSGNMLLFFGYVEYYPLLWAAAVTFINISLCFVLEKKLFWFLILLLLISMSMHLQAFYYLLGLIFLCIYKQNSDKIISIFEKKFTYITISILTVGVLVLILLNILNIKFAQIFLPFYEGKQHYPDYSILSFKHILDLLNLSILIFPGVITIIILYLLRFKENSNGFITKLLILFSIGSLFFLVTIDPVLGLARDWDLMSLTLLTPCLLAVYKLKDDRNLLTVRTVTIYIILTSFITFSYLSVYTNVFSSEQRTFSILKHYGNKDRGGWVAYTKRLRDKNRYNTAVIEMNRFFPEYEILNQVYDLMNRKKYSKAFVLAKKLVDEKPNQADFLQVLATLYSKKGQYDKAESLYKKALVTKKYHVIYNELGQLYQKQRKYQEALKVFKEAHRLSPKTTFVSEGLGLTYIYLKQYNMANLVADSLFIQNKNSPGGHLIKMTVALNKDNQTTAQEHFIEYLKYGSQRSDYKSNSKYYQHLLQNSK